MSREYPCVYYDNQKCNLHSEPGYTDWCVLGPCSHETPSNADRIRAMSDEELAEWLEEIDCFNCDCCVYQRDCRFEYDTETVNYADKYNCIEGRLNWLKQPYKEET